MKSVCLAIPPVDDNYPWRAAKSGLERLGLAVHLGNHTEADMLVTWSPWRGSVRAALQARYYSEGKRVLIMENGWLPVIGGGQFYQVAADGWNGTGTFPAGGPERWPRWGLKPKPWQENPGGHILVIGQRGHPHDDRTAPPGWHETIGPFERPPLRRPREASRPLMADIDGAAEVHVWTSSAASYAVMAGVPVVYHGPNLMVAALASRPGQPHFRGERLPELQRLAWAQWTAEEIATGAPFIRLLALA